jgi:hypothetical protein
MKKILIVILAFSLLPGLALAQQTTSESMREELEQARQEKDEAMDAISLEASLMRSAVRSSRPAPMVAATRPAVKLQLHPALLSLPGRVVMSVLAPLPAPPGPAQLPLVPQKPAVTVEVKPEQQGAPRPGIHTGI